MKFTLEQLSELSEYQKLLLINFSLVVAYADDTVTKVQSTYVEGTDLLRMAKIQMNLSDEDINFLYNFMLENDVYL